MKRRKIRLATRASKLALYQAHRARSAIEANFPDIEITLLVINTKGDKILNVSLSKIGDKGFFTEELEHALLNGSADIAVHSMKDLPTDINPALVIGGVLERGEVRDALISNHKLTFQEIFPGLRIGTSSLRRIAQLKIQFPFIRIVEMRGNVDTRIRKMREGLCDAMVMAAVGLKRLGLDDYIREILDPAVMIPAAGQGAIAMQIRKDDHFLEEVLSTVSHRLTFISAGAERTFLRKLKGGCQIPIGCYSSIRKDVITLSGFVSDVNGNNPIILSKSGPLDQSEKVACELAKEYLDAGAARIIEQIKRDNYEG